MNTVNLSKMTKEQLAELVKAMQATQQVHASGILVKKTEKGGAYIRHPQFVEWSENKGKEYVYGINMPMNTAKKLFNDIELLKVIRDELNKL
jgi:hypothetical protein